MFAGVGEGVVEQVAEDGIEQRLIALDNGCRGEVDYRVDTFLLDLT